MDRYETVDLGMMYNLTVTPNSLDRDLSGHDVTYHRTVQGSKIGASVAFIPFDKKENDYSTKSEIRLGLFYSERGTSLSYFLQDTSGAFKSVNYSTQFKELNLNAAYVWKYNPKFAERFTLSGGLGIGLGSTFNDKTSVAEHFSSGQPGEIPNSIFNVYDGKSSFFGRAYVPFGIDFALGKHFDVGLASTFGVSIQQVYSGENYFIPTNGSLTAKVTYFF